jgi:hypothetical protein
MNWSLASPFSQVGIPKYIIGWCPICSYRGLTTLSCSFCALPRTKTSILRELIFMVDMVSKQWNQKLHVGVKTDRIVLFPHPFSYFQNEYKCKYGYCRIWMRSGCYSNRNTDRIIYQYGADTNSKVIDSYLIVSQVYTMLYAIVSPIIEKRLLSNLVVFLVR